MNNIRSTLTTVWRGDDTEIEALQKLARLYTEEHRYRDAFYVMRSALKAYPDAQISRRIYDDAAATFDSLFLAELSGPGHVWLQSMTPAKLAAAIEPYLPDKTSSNNS